ncbi:hypothetical protein [Acidimangrovimonas pyrenivorans]|uniref:EF-hand domain-containing protein n=1 Tax=Acidimangrovimonas pyrenivorans TaxID=2030798 RepID=A0ABV7AMC0_9RHOB
MVPAPPARAEPVLDLARLGLTARETSSIARDPAASLRRFYTTALGLSPDGTISQQVIESRDRISRARLRGGRIGAVLGYDLNDDGAISSEEIAAVLDTLTGRRRADLLILRDSGDGNGDGRIDMAEIRAYAARQQRTSLLTALSARRYQTLLKMDVDGDGKVTLEEIRMVVAAIAAQRGKTGIAPPTKL